MEEKESTKSVTTSTGAIFTISMKKIGKIVQATISFSGSLADNAVHIDPGTIPDEFLPKSGIYVSALNMTASNYKTNYYGTRYTIYNTGRIDIISPYIDYVERHATCVWIAAK